MDTVKVEIKSYSSYYNKHSTREEIIPVSSISQMLIEPSQTTVYYFRDDDCNDEWYENGWVRIVNNEDAVKVVNHLSRLQAEPKV